MNKRGQFYLIAAIIIIGIVLTSVTAVNYVKTKKQKYPIYSLGDIVNFETGQVLNWGIVNKTNLDELMENWIINYTIYGEKSITGDWFFVYGTKSASETNLKALNISKVPSGAIQLDLGAGSATTYFGEYMVTIVDVDVSEIDPNSDILTMNIMGQTYEFKVKEGQNFWFVITTGNQTTSGTT